MALPMLWGKTETMALIQLYHAKPCLWKVTERDYRNQSKRKSSLEDIALKMQTVRPGTTAKEVQTKINGLRTQFSEQLRKQRRRGGGSTEPYSKVLWCFEPLQFLRHSVVPRPVTNDCPAEDDVPVEGSEHDDAEQYEGGPGGDDELVEESTDPWACVDVKMANPLETQVQTAPAPTRGKREAETATFYDSVIASMLRIAEKNAATVSTAAAATSSTCTSDNLAAYGAYIAGELRSLGDPVQQHLAQMDIQRVIFKRKCAALRINPARSEWTCDRACSFNAVNVSPSEEAYGDDSDDCSAAH